MDLFKDYTVELSFIDIKKPDFENISKTHD